MKYKKGDRVRVVDYVKNEPAHSQIIGKTGEVLFISAYGNIRLDNMPVGLDQVWLFREDELELVE